MMMMMMMMMMVMTTTTTIMTYGMFYCPFSKKHGGSFHLQSSEAASPSPPAARLPPLRPGRARPWPGSHQETVKSWGEELRKLVEFLVEDGEIMRMMMDLYPYIIYVIL